MGHLLVVSDPAAALSPRQQRAKETRDRLFFAACELFVANGYVGTTVDSIAERAGVAKGTFFVHFKTKDAVVRQLIENQMASARRARDRAIAAGGGPLEALRATALALGKQGGASKMLTRAVLAASLESGEVGGDATRLFEDMHQLMLSDARDAEKRGLLARGADPERLAWSLLASYLGACLHFATSPRARPLLDQLTPLVDTSLAAAGARPASTKKKR